MEDEIPNFFKVWTSVSISLCYCYAVGKLIPNGIQRLIFIFPVICIFLYLPLHLHSLHLQGFTAFFIAWLANFKLLLFSFAQPPLASSRSNLSIGSFMALASLPIKFRQGQESQISSQESKSPLKYAIKLLLIAAMVKAYDYSNQLPQKIVWLLMSFHIYFILDIGLAMAAALARSLTGVELEPPFNRPYLATSLQDFWGRRWNLNVTGILRAAVYQPTLRAAAALAVGRRPAQLVAVMATFVVSGIMHELIFFYLSRAWPTWEVTRFFVFHGICLVVEIVVKKVWMEKWRLPEFPPLVCTPVTVGFFLWSCFWLFFPPFITACKADVRVVEEYAVLGAFVKDNIMPHFCPLLRRFGIRENCN